MISFLKKKQVLLLPDNILRRWCKNAKANVVYSNEGSSSTLLMAHHGMLAHKCSLLVDAAVLTDARMEFLMGEFDTLSIRITEIDDGGNVGMGITRSKTPEESDTIQDPSVVRAKGCGKRLKSSKEKSLSKNIRQCSACGQNGHDKRTCPTLNTRSNVEIYHPKMNDNTWTQDESRDDAPFASNASSQCDVINWFL
ncbi:Protein FAR1-RELATED SEQUENCE [Abeliophyllum distichum]|uniref:Protein FAR1-RELATED SEQUENCE n=1 Tax=Abeliophyllum distichum TaxID=126358 RepID=A0ABD1Q546_9LAMI